MIKNYLQSAWRNLVKHRLFSVVNILGLSIGVASFWIIALYVSDEWSFDKYHQKADRIFRVVQHGKWSGGSYDLAVTSLPYAPAMKADYPEVEEAVRINTEGGGSLKYNDKQILVKDILLTDAALFDVFTYHFLAGDPKTALSKPQSIVLTETLAAKLFDSPASAIHKMVLMDGGMPVMVTGVIEDVPANSHFTFSALRPFESNITGAWGNADVYTYALLKDKHDYKKIESRSNDFYSKYLKAVLANVQYRMELQPLASIHLHSNLGYEIGANGNILYVYVFILIALLIVVIAVINYINLTTARSSVRLKEIGVRRVAGSGRKQLMLLFFAESILLALLAMAIAMVIIQASLPFFNQLSGKSLDLWKFGIGKSLLLFAVFAVSAGLISGIYPAFFLSGFATIPALKGQMGDQSSTVIFRKSLVTFQFVITIVMITGSIIIYQQLQFVLHKDLGFNKSQMLTFHMEEENVRSQAAAIKEEMLRSPLIAKAAVAGNPIGNNNIGSRDFNLGEDGKPGPDTKMVQELVVDEDFIPAMEIKIAEGRNFMKGSGDIENSSIIVNATLIGELGWENPVGRRVITGSVNGVPRFSTIIGVAKDFNTYSLQHKIAPMVLRMPQQYKEGDNLYVRINGAHTHEALEYLQKIYQRFDRNNKAEVHFLDQNFASQYQSERKQGSLLFLFTLLAIGISSLGLFGLVTFTAEQRVKEIGIRKVLGASVGNIIALFSTDLLKPALLASVIAFPIAWYAVHQWLQSFAYRIAIGWWVFIASGLIAVIIALATILIRSVKAALENPVKSLRTE